MPQPAQQFRDLIVWQTSHQLVLSVLMNIAEGSLEELRYYFILAVDLGYLREAQVPTLLEDVARLLGAYSRTLLSPVS